MKAIQHPTTAGQKVKFITELEPGENDFEMTVIEMRGDRCLIETNVPSMFIKPTSVEMVNDLKTV